MRHNIGIYVRVSTEEQAQIADGSIDSQQHRINAFIDLKKHQDKHWGVLTETYVDDGYSAGSTNRPAYQRMIADLKKGKINLILVTDLSRLSRNISDFCDLYKEIGKYKANFLSIKEQFDTSTPIGEMMVFNMVNLAQFERKQTSERISMNFHSRAMRGLVNGGNPLLGYDRDPSNAGKRMVNEAEAVLVRKIFQMYDEGLSQSSIAEQLTKEGEKRKDWNGRKYRHIKDGRWTLNAIQNILKNYAYVGKREVNVGNKKEKQEYLKAWQRYQIVEASWPSIIDEAQFNRVQHRMMEAYKLERSRFSNGAKRVFLVSGKINCGHCGHALIGQSAHGKRKVHLYYGHKQLAGEKITCPIKRFPAMEIESAVIKHLNHILNTQGHLNSIEKNIEKSMGTNKLEISSQRETIERCLEKIDGEIDSALKLVTTMKSGSAGFDVVQEKIQKMAERKKELEKGLNLVGLAEENLGALTGAKKFIETNALKVREALKKAKPYLQKKLLGELFQQLVVTDAGLKVFYRLPEDQPLTKKAPGLIPGALHFLNQLSEFFSLGNLPSHCHGGGGGNRTRVRRCA